MASKDMQKITDEEKQSFATGVNSEANNEAVIYDNAPIELNDKTDNLCPISVIAHRDDVEYGKYIHVDYYSDTCKMERGMCLLLPVGFDTKKKYSVMYLLHGIFGNEYSYSEDPNNRIAEIVGNMTAQGLIDETIVVCPNMFATSDPAMEPAFTNEACLPYDNFINELINDVMPYVEKNYPVRVGRENTTLAGFSMGGRETLYIALKRPELFGYVCSISAAPGIVPTKDDFMSHDGMISEEEVKFEEGALEPEAFIVCCGTQDSVVGKYPESYHRLMEKNGVSHIWYEIPEADHDNNAIQSGIFNILKKIAYNRNSQ